MAVPGAPRTLRSQGFDGGDSVEALRGHGEKARNRCRDLEVWERV